MTRLSKKSKKNKQFSHLLFFFSAIVYFMIFLFLFFCFFNIHYIPWVCFICREPHSHKHIFFSPYYIHPLWLSLPFGSAMKSSNPTKSCRSEEDRGEKHYILLHTSIKIMFYWNKLQPEVEYMAKYASEREDGNSNWNYLREIKWRMVFIDKIDFHFFMLYCYIQHDSSIAGKEEEIVHGFICSAIACYVYH